MQMLVISVLAVAASASTVAMATATWRRLAKSVDKGTITVVRKMDGKTVSLPRNYSPAAVEELLELTT